MFAETHFVKRPDGTITGWRHQPAVGEARGILLISHGLAEHSARYARFATTMGKSGFAVYAHDHRGHGITTGPDALIGRFARKDGIACVLDDLKAMRDMASARHPHLPVILFGHSMGGLIALNAAERDPQSYDGLAVWNSNFNPGLSGRAAQGILAVHRFFKGSDTPSHLLAQLSFGKWGAAIADRKTDFDWLSHDEAEVAAYIADPLCGFPATASLWADLMRLTFDGATPHRLNRIPVDLPIHLLGGGEDPATDNGRAVKWLQRRMNEAGLSNVTCTIWPNARHETLNDHDRDAATSTFADWCARIASPRKTLPTSG